MPCPPGKETVKIAMGDILQSLFVILQLFMIFKYSNVIVNRSKRLAKVAFMHCIVSSLCFWLNGIINETRQSLVNHAISHHSDDHSDGKLLCLDVIYLSISQLNEYNNVFFFRKTTLHYVSPSQDFWTSLVIVF